jgi:methylglyoxal/glyoxal reductase
LVSGRCFADNARIFDFELTAEDLSRLDALDRTGGTGNALERPWG